VVLAGLLLANGGLWYLQQSGAAARVEVVSTEGTQREALGRPRELKVEGHLGATRILVEADGARVLDSPCPLKLCVAAGKITRAGEVVACLPNRVALRLLGGASDRGVDAVGR